MKSANRIKNLKETHTDDDDDGMKFFSSSPVSLNLATSNMNLMIKLIFTVVRLMNSVCHLPPKTSQLKVIMSPSA